MNKSSKITLLGLLSFAYANANASAKQG